MAACRGSPSTISRPRRAAGRCVVLSARVIPGHERAVDLGDQRPRALRRGHHRPRHGSWCTVSGTQRGRALKLTAVAGAPALLHPIHGQSPPALADARSAPRCRGCIAQSVGVILAERRHHPLHDDGRGRRVCAGRPRAHRMADEVLRDWRHGRGRPSHVRARWPSTSRPAASRRPRNQRAASCSSPIPRRCRRSRPRGRHRRPHEVRRAHGQAGVIKEKIQLSPALCKRAGRRPLFPSSWRFNVAGLSKLSGDSASSWASRCSRLCCHPAIALVTYDPPGLVLNTGSNRPRRELFLAERLVQLFGTCCTSFPSSWCWWTISFLVHPHRRDSH